MKTGYDIGNAYKELQSWWVDEASLADVEDCLGAKKPFLAQLYFEAEILDSHGFRVWDANFQDCFNVLLLYLISGLLKRKEFRPVSKYFDKSQTSP